jgi:PqqD family protein of HPr-rel-A system
MTRRFALAPAAGRVAPIGDCVAVFNAASFETHVCNPAAGALLELIAEQPRSVDELAAHLAEWLAPEQRATAAAHAEAVLEQLRSLGLVNCQEAP